MDEVKKEFGKWFFDIAKYITTAVVLASLFNGVESTMAVVILGITAIVFSMSIGTWLLYNKNKKED